MSDSRLGIERRLDSSLQLLSGLPSSACMIPMS